MTRIVLVFSVAASLAVGLSRAQSAVVTFTSEADFLNAFASTQLIDFDVDADGNLIAAEAAISNQYQALGIAFSPFNGGNPRTAPGQPFMPAAVSEPNLLRTVPGATGQAGGGFEVAFGKPAMGIGMFFGDIQNDGLDGSTILEILDGGGASIHTEDVTAILGDSPSQWKFFGLRSTEPFAKAQISIGDEDFVVFDNLRFTTIPTPSAMASGAALVGLVMIGRLLRSCRN